MAQFNFPKGFFWGAATSAHQAEGGNKNDWTEWERANCARLAAEAAERRANSTALMPDYILKNHPNPLEEENYISGRACDHYHRFREDFDIAEKLGHNAHRFSLEWSRIEPEQGKFDKKEIEHYRQAILALRERNIEPFITLWHFTNPLWFQNIGGWANKNSVKYFPRYAAKMAEEFSGVKFWITLNEPNVYTSLSYLIGRWPPQKKSLIKYLSANRHLSLAHIEAYKNIKRINNRAEIGIAHNVIYFSGPLAPVKRFFWNRLFVRSIRDYQDFIGINYYFSDRNTKEHSDFSTPHIGNWPIDPEGLYFVLKEAKDCKKPVYITENGIADARDAARAKFIKKHIAAAARALKEGIDVRGYFYWSLLDNFEWDSGFWPRFGLVEIDYQTLERKIRPSAWEYKKITREGLTIN